MERIDLQKDTYSEDIKHEMKGFPERKDINNIGISGTGRVLKGMEYRPDKVAQYYLGDGSYAWAIFFVNNFTNGISELRLGREIKLPKIGNLA